MIFADTIGLYVCYESHWSHADAASIHAVFYPLARCTVGARGPTIESSTDHIAFVSVQTASIIAGCESQLSSLGV